jgi:hypothetical protein
MILDSAVTVASRCACGVMVAAVQMGAWHPPRAGFLVLWFSLFSIGFTLGCYMVIRPYRIGISDESMDVRRLFRPLRLKHENITSVRISQRRYFRSLSERDHITNMISIEFQTQRVGFLQASRSQIGGSIWFSERQFDCSPGQLADALLSWFKKDQKDV